MRFIIAWSIIAVIWMVFVFAVQAANGEDRTDSIYRIKTPDGSAGTAFVVHTAPDATILATASHVTQYKDIRTQMYAGNAYVIADAKDVEVTKAACISMDIEKDIALVKTDKPVQGAAFEIITDVDKEVLGQTSVTPSPGYYPKKLLIRIRGYADGFKETIGFYSFTHEDNIMADATGLPGQSGGPILLDDKVIGVISGGHSWYRYTEKGEERSATWPVRGGSGRRLKEMLEAKIR